MSPASFPRTSLIPEGTEIDPRKILELTQRLDSDKTHGCDDVSISMLKICDEAIVLPLKLIYTNCLEKVVCINLWKRENVLFLCKNESLCATVIMFCHCFNF